MERDARIMVVDDHPEMVALIHQILVLEGFRVETAGSGEAALEMFPIFKPDLILLDIIMPGLDGFWVLQRVRRISDVPVIMLTAKADIESKAATLVGGADGYITKPFMIRELIARIRAKLRRVGPTVLELQKSSSPGKPIGSAGAGGASPGCS